MSRPNLSSERRAKLLPEVARTFARLGYRRTTTAELARRCSVRENILYRLWPDKKSMFIASIDFVFELSVGIWQERLKAGDQINTEAERLLDYESVHHGEFGFYRIVFAALSETDDSEIREAVRRMYSKFHSFIEQRIDVHSKSLSKSSPSDAALLSWAFLGLGTISNLGREFELLSDADRARLFREVGRLFLQGSGDFTVVGPSKGPDRNRQ
jgi:AcrR family transcriptional regulator